MQTKDSDQKGSGLVPTLLLLLAMFLVLADPVPALELLSQVHLH